MPVVEIVPDADTLVNVPTDVMLGCAAVVTVPALVALVALATMPVTLAPVILVRPAPEPVKDAAIAAPVTEILPPARLPV